MVSIIVVFSVVVFVVFHFHMELVFHFPTEPVACSAVSFEQATVDCWW